MEPQKTILIFTLLIFQTHNNNISARRLGNETDKLALLEFKSRISSSDILASWNNNVPHCKWQGVTCGNKHHRITALDLSGHNLFGPISPHIGNLSFLKSINLQTNRLNGEIPQEIGKLSRLIYLNLFNNTIGGEIPMNLSYCTELNFLDLARNNFTGKIPTGLESLEKLITLYLSSNKLKGEIPPSIGNLSSLETIYLTENKLQGNIPYELSKLTRLKTFAIGVNDISGKKLTLVSSSEENKLTRISYWELDKATNGFSSINLIGSGGFGTVYKGMLNQQTDKLVAVKVLNLENSRASKSFVAECRVLRNIRHRNLVKILTYCSSIDSKCDEFKALVYEYMPNGNLDTWLHPDEANTSRKLNLLQRLNIANDVASAVHYLHLNCKPPVIHCDLKPSNILLDSEMCAHVGDFGLARFLPNTTGALEIISSIGVKGSIGYTAPEYGTGAEISTHGDVYAYGILLLEMITGRRPTDNIFKDGLNLHKFAKEALPDQVSRIIDPALYREQQRAPGAENEGENNEIITEMMEEQGQIIGNTSITEFDKNIIAIVTIGVACSEESPANRMDMNDVSRELHRVILQ